MVVGDAHRAPGPNESQLLLVRAAALVVLGLGATASVSAVRPPFPAASAALVPVLVAAFLVAELAAFDVTFRGEPHSVRIYELVLVVALSFFAAPLVIGGAALAAVAAIVIERGPPASACCRFGARLFGTALAAYLFHALMAGTESAGPRLWASALVAAVASSALGRIVALPRPASAVSSAWTIANAVISATLGLVFVVVLYIEPAAVALLVAPALVVFVACRAYVAERRKTEGLRFLYGASQVLQRASGLDGSLVALLLFARETFTAELTELVVYDSVDPGTAYVTTVGPGAQRAAMIACDRADVDGRLARASVMLGSTMVAPFSGASGVSGAVLVADTLASGRTFKRDEERLLRTFAGQLATTLEKAQINASLAKARVQKNEFAHQASHDALTGLANRSRFRQCLADGLPAAAAAGTGLAALFIDLDDFKTVNDTMGHAAGDELLRVVAQRISVSIGANDVAARLGGDEFAVLLVDVDNDSDVQVVAERILVVLGDPIEIDGRRVIANASIGAAMHTAGEDADALMQNADIAMYTAKRNGKGRCDFFEPSLTFSGTRRRLVESGLQRALEAGELVLHYQPVVDVARNQIVAIEALVRWCDPSRGLVPPAEFIRVAEETSLIVPIGRFVLREACQQAKAWETLAPEMRMFVNLSARELNEPDLADHVARILAETGLEPSRLILEVTDAAVMQNMGAARRTLNALKHLGVGLGLDDIGPGYAALQHLRHLPIDVLKIAKPWIDALGNTEADVTAVRELVELGHAVGLHVVAEGVERVDQAAELIDMGCEWAQGYYYARSLESEAIGTLLCRANARAGARRETKEQTELELAE